VIHLILKSMVTGNMGLSCFFLRVQLPEVNVSFYLEGCGKPEGRIILFSKVQLPEVSDSSNFVK
jgi:hypothetical protein